MSALLKLEILKSGQLLQEVAVSDAEIWVGRDEGCGIRLEDRAISRRHALMRATPAGVEFEKKSKFGWIKVNGSDSTQALLKNGDFIELGPYEIRVKSEEIKPASKVEAVEAPLAEAAATPEPAVEAPADSGMT